MSDCDKTSLYFDGALTAAEEETALAHLASCAACQAELGDFVGIEAAMSRTPAASRAAASRDRGMPRWLTFAGAGTLVAAAAASIFLLRGLGGSPGDRGGQLALADTRGVEARLTARGFDQHRPYRVARGGGDHETVPLSALAALERKGDRAGIAAAQILAGDVARARAVLEAMPESAARDSDLAAAALAGGQLDDALRWSDAALAAAPALSPARWNHALALRELALPLAAAEQLDGVVAGAEPGWSDEAKALADSLRRPVREALADSAAFTAAARALVTGAGPAPAADAIRRHPGPARKAFYDALAAAGTADEARALSAMAAELDGLSGTEHASRALEHVLLRDFALRRRFQARYRAFVAGELDEPARRALVAELAAAGPAVDDLRVAVLPTLPTATELLADYRAVVSRVGDPWFGFQLARIEGRQRVAAGDLTGAEQVLVTALGACEQGRWDLQCANLGIDLSDVYSQLRRTEQATARLEAARAAYRAAGAPEHEVYAISQLASAEWLRVRLYRSRAYLAELRARSDNGCPWTRYIDDLEAMIAIERGDLAAVRAHQVEPGRCGLPIGASQLAVAADLARDGDDADRARADALVAAARADKPVAAAMAEGRMGLDRRLATGVPRLREALAMLGRDGQDVNSVQLRAWGYAALLEDATARSDWTGALAVVGDELGRALPDGCLVIASADDGRAIAVVRGANGTVRGHLERRPQGAIDAASIVPAVLTQALHGCDSIAVVARPPLHGRPELLPPRLPWAFLGAAHAQAASGKARRTVVIGDARPPSSLGLPALSPVAPPSDAVLVAGPAATPSRVLAELRDATYVEIHAHGLVDLDASDASLVALSPDADGRYALTAGAVRATRLAGAPVVALAACRTAEPRPLQRRRWTLPDAFLDAGASAVIAAATAIPDDQAAALFAELRQRLAAGEPPAKALAALRASRIAAGQGWAAGLVLFE